MLTFPGKPPLSGSADPAFRGDGTRYNPEELIVASLSACHMLWYLHLAAVAGVTVVDYVDAAEGVLETADDGSGRFTEVILHPVVTIARGSVDTARRLHVDAHRFCFIANSVNFPVRHEPSIRLSEASGERRPRRDPRRDAGDRDPLAP